jgi:hypothetical protein
MMPKGNEDALTEEELDMLETLKNNTLVVGCLKEDGPEIAQHLIDRGFVVVKECYLTTFKGSSYVRKVEYSRWKKAARFNRMRKLLQDLSQSQN